MDGAEDSAVGEHSTNAAKLLASMIAEAGSEHCLKQCVPKRGASTLTEGEQRCLSVCGKRILLAFAVTSQALSAAFSEAK
jgi:hypothetical protein